MARGSMTVMCCLSHPPARTGRPDVPTHGTRRFRASCGTTISCRPQSRFPSTFATSPCLDRVGACPMSIGPLVLIAAFAAGSAAADDPKALVAQLGSAEAAARAEATRALEALGREALPALVEA